MALIPPGIMTCVAASSYDTTRQRRKCTDFELKLSCPLNLVRLRMKPSEDSEGLTPSLKIKILSQFHTVRVLRYSEFQDALGIFLEMVSLPKIMDT